MRKQAICESPTPVLNTPYFKTIFGGHSGNDLLRDEKGHMRALEFVALTNTRFEIELALPRHDHYIFKVRCPQYPSEALYVDSRFVKLVPRSDAETPSPPNKEKSWRIHLVIQSPTETLNEGTLLFSLKFF